MRLYVTERKELGIHDYTGAFSRWLRENKANLPEKCSFSHNQKIKIWKALTADVEGNTYIGKPVDKFDVYDFLNDYKISNPEGSCKEIILEKSEESKKADEFEEKVKADEKYEADMKWALIDILSSGKRTKLREK